MDVLISSESPVIPLSALWKRLCKKKKGTQRCGTCCLRSAETVRSQYYNSWSLRKSSPLSRESLSGESQVFTSSSDCNCIEWKPLLIKQIVCFQGNRESEEKTMALIDEDPKGCTLMWNKLQMKVYSSRTLATDQEFMKEWHVVLFPLRTDTFNVVKHLRNKFAYATAAINTRSLSRFTYFLS